MSSWSGEWYMYSYNGDGTCLRGTVNGTCTHIAEMVYVFIER